MPASLTERLFEELFRDHHLMVLRFAQRRLGDDMVAWDVVSETFLVAWRSWQRRPATPPETRAWLYTIAGNAVRNQQRAGVRAARLAAKISVAAQRPGILSTRVGDIADEAVGKDVALSALEQLPDGERELLRLVAWEGLDLAELAAVLAISPSAAKVRLHRARRRLQKALGGTAAMPAPAVPIPPPIEGRP
ncbi:RNA polymerase sigma factor [Protofrankia symbiont of Coriaria ruscifolia]|uniref:RNA polymerase, sigma-24 subunit, ECF subfamily n=1 Tax=Candidatus Protofrankia californiensis TaxID=1839754 RepID=A0A1C3NVW7_9ACTN|nr:sigma-70 family RNA polymerase sigma factor [Protofrankia symbiont of Coriaria ruscifolia]SBW20050.1 RNA polymerase, sigma-24 subunit, ECF subfamily [Candidatus Protofrankia californiensis]